MSDWRNLVDGHNHIPLLVRRAPEFVSPRVGQNSDASYSFGEIDLRMGMVLEALDMLGSWMQRSNAAIMKSSRHFREKSNLVQGNVQRFEDLLDVLLPHVISVSGEMHGAATGEPVVAIEPSSMQASGAKRRDAKDWVQNLRDYFGKACDEQMETSCTRVWEVLMEPQATKAFHEYFEQQPQDVHHFRQRMSAYCKNNNQYISMR